MSGNLGAKSFLPREPPPMCGAGRVALDFASFAARGARRERRRSASVVAAQRLGRRSCSVGVAPCGHVPIWPLAASFLSRRRLFDADAGCLCCGPQGGGAPWCKVMLRVVGGLGLTRSATVGGREAVAWGAGGAVPAVARKFDRLRLPDRAIGGPRGLPPTLTSNKQDPTKTQTPTIALGDNAIGQSDGPRSWVTPRRPCADPWGSAPREPHGSPCENRCE